MTRKAPVVKKNIIEKELSYQLVGIFFTIQNELGRYCRERQYCDAFEKYLSLQKLQYRREHSATVAGRLSNRFDFLIEGRVVVDIKAKPFVEKQDYFQMQRYLQSANLPLGIIVNFRSKFLFPKRILNPGHKSYSQNS